MTKTHPTQHTLASRLAALALVLATALSLALVPARPALAEPTTIEVTTSAGLEAAFDRANATAGEYVFHVRGAIVDESGNGFTLSNAGSTVTLYGDYNDAQDHMIQLSTTTSSAIMVTDGTLNLGLPDGGTQRSLTINGVSSTHHSAPLIYINGGTVNMYDGVTLRDRDTDSVATQHGQAVRIHSGTFNMYGGEIRNCTHTQYHSTNGGGVAVMGDTSAAYFTMSGGTIHDCGVLGKGGGVYVYTGGSFTMTGGTIYNCTAGEGGGVAVYGGTATLAGGTIRDNTSTGVSTSTYARMGGGGVLVQGTSSSTGRVTIGGATISGNRALMDNGYSGYGAGVLADYYADVRLASGTVSGNTAQARGGGLAALSGGTITMSGGTVDTNTADNDGGGIYLGQGSGTVTGGTISNNRAGNRGGGIFRDGAHELSVSNATITGNTATKAGGGIGALATLTLTDCQVTRNTAGTDGGGVYVETNATVTGCAIESNTAAANGGGIWSDGVQLEISGSTTIKGNQASGTATTSGYGGGLYHSGPHSTASTVSIADGVVVSGNTAQYGGGIYNRIYSGGSKASTVTMTGGTIRENTASYGGGVANAGTFNMSGGIITKNTATVDGGGVYTNMRLSTGGSPAGAFLMSGSAQLHNNTAANGADIATENTAAANFQLVDAGGMGATLERSGLAITGWYEDGRYTSAGKVAGTNWSNTDPTHYVDHSSDYNTTTDWYGALYLIAAHGESSTATYTVTYEYNGTVPQGAPAVPTARNYAEGATVAVADLPTLVGYTFSGWSSEQVTPTSTLSGASELSAASTPSNQQFTMPGHNVTFVGSWAINSHTITFDTKGGSAVDPITGDYGSVVTAPADPTRPGYTFAGWDREIPATMPDEDLTISATWTPVEYAIAYDLGGGAVAGTNPAAYTVESDTITLINPTRPGYVFAGWTGTGLDGATMTVTIPKGSTGDRAYAATWTPAAPGEHTITFDTRGGSAVAPITQQAGTPVTAPADPTRPGYVFDGWDVPVPATMPDHDMTITAKWKPATPTPGAETHTVTFDTNGGSPVAPGTAEHGRPVARPADPTRDGFDFAGWYADAALTVLWDFSRPVTGDMTLHAAWTPRATPARTAAGETLVPRAQATSARQAQGSPAALPRTGEDALPVAFVVVVGLAATALGAWLALRRREG